VENVPTRPPVFIEGLLLKNADLEKSTINRLEKTVEWLIKESAELEELKRNFASNEIVESLTDLSNSFFYDRNIALGKIASQSSLSAFSSPNDPYGAINGIKTGKFGFHTDIQVNPWWMVDLGEIFDLHNILICNRLDAQQARIKTLQCFTSLDGDNWTIIYDHENKLPFGGIRAFEGIPPLFLHLNRLKARFVKLQLKETNCLHLDQVEIYGTRS